MHNYLLDLGVGSESGDLMCDLVISHVIRTMRGEKVRVLILDCCNNGRCGIVAYLAKFLVDELAWPGIRSLAQHHSSTCLPDDCQ